MKSLKILHLSDLHERGPRESVPYERTRVLGQTWKDNLGKIQEGGPVDLLCFTGDVAQSGKTDEYRNATKFFQQTLSTLALPLSRLFIVPGNHDIDRSVAPDCWHRLRDASARSDARDFSHWMAGHPHKSNLQGRWRSEILLRQQAFRDWVQQECNGAGGVADYGQIGFRRSLEINTIPLHIFGLDSAWLAGEGIDHESLRLTLDQIMRIATEDGEPLGGLRLALMHHPLEDLVPGDRSLCLRELSRYADLVLRGHLHKTSSSIAGEFDQQLRELATSCLFDGDHGEKYKNGCQVLTLFLDDEDQLIELEVWVRSWSTDSHEWFDDNERYKGSRDGRRRFQFPRESKSIRPSIPGSRAPTTIRSTSNRGDSSPPADPAPAPISFLPSVPTSLPLASITETEDNPVVVHRASRPVTIIGHTVIPLPEVNSPPEPTHDLAPKIEDVLDDKAYAAGRLTTVMHTSGGVIVTGNTEKQPTTKTSHAFQGPPTVKVLPPEDLESGSDGKRHPQTLAIAFSIIMFVASFVLLALVLILRSHL